MFKQNEFNILFHIKMEKCITNHITGNTTKRL